MDRVEITSGVFSNETAVLFQESIIKILKNIIAYEWCKHTNSVVFGGVVVLTNIEVQRLLTENKEEKVVYAGDRCFYASSAKTEIFVEIQNPRAHNIYTGLPAYN